jgi:hypothetical protein
VGLLGFFVWVVLVVPVYLGAPYFFFNKTLSYLYKKKKRCIILIFIAIF